MKKKEILEVVVAISIIYTFFGIVPFFRTVATFNASDPMFTVVYALTVMAWLSPIVMVFPFYLRERKKSIIKL